MKHSHTKSYSYYPLALILAYLLALTLGPEILRGHLNWMRWMSHFMAGFFLAFSFFKFLDLRGFADAYRTYDILAKKFPVYGLIYPWIELGLGLTYFLNKASHWTHLITLGVAIISSVGVVQVLSKKQQVQCACLGTVFNLPMTKVTLFENALMVMAGAMIALR